MLVVLSPVVGSGFGRRRRGPLLGAGAVGVCVANRRELVGANEGRCKGGGDNILIPARLLRLGSSGPRRHNRGGAVAGSIAIAGRPSSSAAATTVERVQWALARRQTPYKLDGVEASSPRAGLITPNKIGVGLHQNGVPPQKVEFVPRQKPILLNGVRCPHVPVKNEEDSEAGDDAGLNINRVEVVRWHKDKNAAERD